MKCEFLTRSLFITSFSLAATFLLCQDSLTVEQLAPLTKIFSLEKGILSGEGADFLKKEFSKAQYTMLGEYHGSKNISEFTQAIIPLLDDCDYKRMGLEVGPKTGDLLNDMNGSIPAQMRAINDKYLIQEEDEYYNTPIPFFDHVEDAQFLGEAKKREWEIFGIDQEFFYTYGMLVDLIYDQLNSGDKKKLKNAYKKTQDSIQQYYLDDIEGDKDFTAAMNNSKVVQNFLDAAKIEENNIDIIEALEASLYIYTLYDQRQWFENNSTRISYMKEQLRKSLTEDGFDLSKDKMLMKMGGYHVSRGFSPLGLYEVGNTLSELAEYHGNKALNIGFTRRFYMEDGELKDILNSENEYFKRLTDLVKMGRETEWIVIDLRPLIKGHFYRPIKYRFNEHVENLVKQFDLLIIPATETDPTINYTTTQD